MLAKYRAFMKWHCKDCFSNSTCSSNQNIVAFNLTAINYFFGHPIINKNDIVISLIRP